jgi:hypothetical protein
VCTRCCAAAGARRAPPFLRRPTLIRVRWRAHTTHVTTDTTSPFAHAYAPSLSPARSCASRTFWCRASSTRAWCCARTWTRWPSRAPSQRRDHDDREHASVASQFSCTAPPLTDTRPPPPRANRC